MPAIAHSPHESSMPAVSRASSAIRGVAESCKRLRQLDRIRQRRKCDRRERDRPQWERLQDEAQNRPREDRKQMPRLRRQPLGHQKNPQDGDQPRRQKTSYSFAQKSPLPDDNTQCPFIRGVLRRPFTYCKLYAILCYKSNT